MIFRMAFIINSYAYLSKMISGALLLSFQIVMNPLKDLLQSTLCTVTARNPDSICYSSY